MAREKIGDWTTSDLARFIQSAITNTPATLPASLEGDELKANTLLHVAQDIELSSQAVQKLKTYLGIP